MVFAEKVMVTIYKIKLAYDLGVCCILADFLKNLVRESINFETKTVGSSYYRVAWFFFLV